MYVYIYNYYIPMKGSTFSRMGIIPKQLGRRVPKPISQIQRIAVSESDRLVFYFRY